jgi:hypothetical protein
VDAITVGFIHREPAVFQHQAGSVCSMSNTAENDDWGFRRFGDPTEAYCVHCLAGARCVRYV